MTVNEKFNKGELSFPACSLSRGIIYEGGAKDGKSHGIGSCLFPDGSL